MDLLIGSPPAAYEKAGKTRAVWADPLSAISETFYTAQLPSSKV